MTKTVRLLSGTDTLDLRGQFGDAVDTLPAGREVPRFVFHALDARSTNVDLALRGRPVEVEDAVAEELLTLPGLVFDEGADAETTTAQAYRLTLTRDPLGRLFDPALGEVVPEDTTRPPVGAAVIAVGVPQSGEALTAEVQHELTPVPAPESPPEPTPEQPAEPVPVPVAVAANDMATGNEQAVPPPQ